MVNKGQIHRKIRKFMMISSNLIKSDNKLMIEIGDNVSSLSFVLQLLDYYMMIF